MNGFFLIRVAYVFACWAILLIPVNNSTSVTQLASSFMLYYLPLGLDYWRHVPITADDKRRKLMGVIIPVIVTTICFVLIVISSQLDLPFILSKWITVPTWILSGFFVWLAIRDFISYSDEGELRSRAETREKQRERALNYRIETEERIKYYQQASLRRHVTKNSRKRKRKRG